MLPAPDWVCTMISAQDIKTLTFTVSPIFFNIGINEHATIADKLGQNEAQERNNSDNLKILADYVRRYNKIKPEDEIRNRFRGKQTYLLLFSIGFLEIQVWHSCLLSTFDYKSNGQEGQLGETNDLWSGPVPLKPL